MSEMRDWFFLREGFDNFNLDPFVHRRFLIGDHDRQRRDDIMKLLEGAANSLHGQKAVVYGDFGRGKTHLSNHLVDLVERRGLGLVPMYIRCGEYTSKERFGTLFRDMVLCHKPAELRRLATEYVKLVDAGEAEPLGEVIRNEDVATVFTAGLVIPNDLYVKRYQRWLGGDPKVDMTSIPIQGIQEQLTMGREYAAVVKALAHLYRAVDNKLLLYIVDEGERVESVTHADTFTTWKSAIREITEVSGLATIFFVGAKSRNELPVLFVHPEIMRRIGTANYTEMMNPSKDELREFLLELMQTLVRKGEAPEQHWEALDAPNGNALDDTVPEELLDLVEHDDDRLETFPFEPDAFDEFVEHLLAAEFGNKPSEALARLQKAAQTAHTSGLRTITTDIVDDIQGQGF